MAPFPLGFLKLELCQKAHATTAATAAATATHDELWSAQTLPSPTHPGVTYPVRGTPHSDLYNIGPPYPGIGVRGSLGTPFKGKIGGPGRKIWIFGVFGVFEFFSGVLGLKTCPNVFLDLLG